jgi:SAM-dependent methyltransferase
MAISETAKHRSKVVQYCTGNGLDLGSAGDPIVPHAVQVELPNPYCPFLAAQYPPQLRGQAHNLHWFRDGVMDFVYSSHLLEDYADWHPPLRELIRVLRPGGHLVILLPDKQRWNLALSRGQPPNLAHKHEGRAGEVSAHVLSIAPFECLHDGLAEPNDDRDYTLIFVGKKV